ncbi:MAG: hypothetical protein LBL65_02840 [Campylobacteraceae bacterium]|jgi:hypothetical protein|nr:hypothetical protein [Campylobacteraceae bacterium]
MKKIFFAILLSFCVFSPNAYAVSVGELACEAVLCLSTVSPPGQCYRSLKYYYSIDTKRVKDLAKARVNFLKLCINFKGDVKQIVANAPADNPLSGGGNYDTTNSGASSSYTGNGKNGLSEGAYGNDNSYGENGKGNSGYSRGSSLDSGNLADIGSAEGDDSKDSNSSQKIVADREKNAAKDSGMIDSDDDGVLDISLGELKLMCSAEELNKIQDFSKTKVRTTAKLPDYCLALLDFETDPLPVYTCKEEFYLNKDWEKGYVGEECELEKYKAWKANEGEGHTLISHDGTAVTYIINRPVKKECWIEPDDVEYDEYINDTDIQEVGIKISDNL